MTLSKFSLLILIIALQPLSSRSQSKLDSTVLAVQEELEAIRGASFKKAVPAQNQSLDDFGHYIDRMISTQFSEELLVNYGKIVKTVGLYRGPEITDFKKLLKSVMQSQAAAYYDPSTSTFYVVMQGLPEIAMKSLYAHELYHGFQDQHHDLEAFLLSQAGGELNDDELLARQAVVEGEATYIMTLWAVQKMMGSLPTPQFMESSIKMQANLKVSQLLQMMQGSASALAQSEDMKKAVEAMNDIPPFLIETMVGSYLKGMAFVFEIQKRGWATVDSLYLSPPVSSEQILHPEKWLTNEKPMRLTLPRSDEIAALQDWKLLESNTIGELQWRTIFTEYELDSLSEAVSAGWNGDVFAVFENSASNELLLLIYTTWDSEAEADEFYRGYKQLLGVKYAAMEKYHNIQIKDRDVWIIEGGGDSSGYAEYLQRVTKINP